MIDQWKIPLRLRFYAYRVPLRAYARGEYARRNAWKLNVHHDVHKCSLNIFKAFARLSVHCRNGVQEMPITSGFLGT
jgi:hypothetical protein